MTTSTTTPGAGTRERAGDVRLPLSGRMVFDRIEELHAVLMDALARGTTLELDLAEVVELDGAGVQLLLFAKRTALARGQKVCLVRESRAVRELFEQFNLRSVFGGPMLCLWDEEGER